MAKPKFHDRLTDEQRKRLDEAYKTHFGEDFRALAPADYEKIAKRAEHVSQALYPAPKNPAREELESSGGLDPKEARRLAIFSAWERGDAPPEPYTPEKLKSYGAPTDSPTMKKLDEERTAKWRSDTESRYNVFTPEQITARVPKSKQTEIEPEEFTARAAPKKRAGKKPSVARALYSSTGGGGRLEPLP